ncbi:hypothetical protein COCON_G00116980 [Conger conger]|uniref:Uncharacterized protein n=1 Tax=Conger conger TaxID=82655 RepID=A0A9Q1DGE9_CONCO|nr:hypothetical protein COCON_G00116980 [Conger conger]
MWTFSKEGTPAGSMQYGRGKSAKSQKASAFPSCSASAAAAESFDEIGLLQFGDCLALLFKEIIPCG